MFYGRMNLARVEAYRSARANASLAIAIKNSIPKLILRQHFMPMLESSFFFLACVPCCKLYTSPVDLEKVYSSANCCPSFLFLISYKNCIGNTIICQHIFCFCVRASAFVLIDSISEKVLQKIVERIHILDYFTLPFKLPVI